MRPAMDHRPAAGQRGCRRQEPPCRETARRGHSQVSTPRLRLEEKKSSSARRQRGACRCRLCNLWRDVEIEPSGQPIANPRTLSHEANNWREAIVSTVILSRSRKAAGTGVEEASRQGRSGVGAPPAGRSCSAFDRAGRATSRSGSGWREKLDFDGYNQLMCIIPWIYTVLYKILKVSYFMLINKAWPMEGHYRVPSLFSKRSNQALRPP